MGLGIDGRHLDIWREYIAGRVRQIKGVVGALVHQPQDLGDVGAGVPRSA